MTVQLTYFKMFPQITQHNCYKLKLCMFSFGTHKMCIKCHRFRDIKYQSKSKHNEFKRGLSTNAHS